jgi:hypothetical protein
MAGQVPEPQACSLHPVRRFYWLPLQFGHDPIDFERDVIEKLLKPRAADSSSRGRHPACE